MLKEYPYSIIETTFADAQAAGCDLVQAKATGEPGRIRFSGGKARVTGYDKSVRLSFDVDDLAIDCVLYGHLFPREHFPRHFFLVIDAFAVGGQTIIDQGYRSRFAYAKTLVASVNHPLLKLVANYPIDKASDLWDHLDPVYANGLVYRKSTDDASSPIRITRKHRERPGGLP
jgi:hypothetical protein